MKYALKPLAACMATLFGAASFNVWGAPPTTPPVQTQNQTPGGAQIGAPVATVPTVLATRPMTSVFPTQPNEFPGIPWGSFLEFPEVLLPFGFERDRRRQRVDHVIGHVGARGGVGARGVDIVVVGGGQRHFGEHQERAPVYAGKLVRLGRE